MAATVSSARPETTGRSTSAVSGGTAANVRAVVVIYAQATKDRGLEPPVPPADVPPGNPYGVNPRAATTGVFFINGAAVGLWVAQIPWIQDRFGFSKGTLGFVLLGMSIGVIVALPIMGQAIVSLGSARAVRLAGITCCLLVPLPVLAPEPWLLPLALLVFGAAGGSMDVSMNAHGSAIEGRMGRPIMSSLHAGWSFGGFFGAAFVAGATAAGLDPRVQNTAGAAVLLA